MFSYAFAFLHELKNISVFPQLPYWLFSPSCSLMMVYSILSQDVCKIARQLYLISLNEMAHSQI